MSLSLVVLPVILPMVLIGVPGPVLSGDMDTVRPLRVYASTDLASTGLRSVLPPGTILLQDSDVIERFLEALDGSPPDWKAIYGPDGDGAMDRLFDVNRQRDRQRDGKPGLKQRVAFVWEGILSGYDRFTGGFRLAIGPKVIPTGWGHVRFKPSGLPSGLVAVPPPGLRERLRKKKAGGRVVDVDLLLTGRLIPEESIIYDFAHEEPGQGMIMPVVQIEHVEYFLAR